VTALSDDGLPPAATSEIQKNPQATAGETTGSLPANTSSINSPTQGRPELVDYERLNKKQGRMDGSVFGWRIFPVLGHHWRGFRPPLHVQEQPFSLNVAALILDPDTGQQNSSPG